MRDYEKTKNKEIENTALKLYELIELNGFYSREDLEALRKICLKSQGKPAKHYWE